MRELLLVLAIGFYAGYWLGRLVSVKLTNATPAAPPVSEAQGSKERL
jgi:hypothetical protein